MRPALCCQCGARDEVDQKLKMSFSRFHSLAWEAANLKASELGWIKIYPHPQRDNRRAKRESGNCQP
jgi:hypothetical protein